MKNPWRTLSKKLIYQNTWMKLREDHVITPSGTPGIYGVVETPPALGIVPVTDDLDTYLVGQYRYPLDSYSWEIPEGGGKETESLLDGAKRELREETGLVATQWTALGKLHTSNCFTDETGYVFLAEGLSEHEARPDPTELLAIKKLPLLDAWQLVLQEEITDALSIIGLMRVCRHFQREGKLGNLCLDSA